ncbi:MAG TPA: hypothetical protein VNA20_05115 [Frankiaceae bacterium]|nr:hypothetical protein [Frankiaceae bacterium]
MKLRSALGTLVLVLTLGGTVPAAQAQYPPTVSAGRVSRSEVKQCQCTMFTGDGFAPNSSVAIYDRGPDGVEEFLGTATTDNRGTFRFKACFDENDDQGSHTLIGRGTGVDGRPREVRATVDLEDSACVAKGDGPDGNGNGNGPDTDVGAGRDNRGNGLPRTGAEYVLPGLLLGFLLVVTGSGAVHIARRRRLVAP